MKWVEVPSSYIAQSHQIPELFAIAGLFAFLIVCAILAAKSRAPNRSKNTTKTNRSKGTSTTNQSRFRGSFHTKPSLGPVTKPLLTSRPSMAIATAQMDAINKVQFKKTRLLNRSEARLLPILEGVVHSSQTGHRVMAQTSLGELIKPSQYKSETDRKNAHASINSKRLDFAIIDSGGYLVCAIEYQGAGHYQGDAFMRDAVKREALRRAGVPMIEIPDTYSPDDVADTIQRILNPDALGSQHRKPAVNM